MSNAQLNQNVSVSMDVDTIAIRGGHTIAARGKDTRKGKDSAKGNDKDKFNCNHLCKGRHKRRGQKGQQELSTDDRRCFSSDRRGHIAQDCRMQGVSDIPSILSTCRHILDSDAHPGKNVSAQPSRSSTSDVPSRTMYVHHCQSNPSMVSCFATTSESDEDLSEQC